MQTRGGGTGARPPTLVAIVPPRSRACSPASIAAPSASGRPIVDWKAVRARESSRSAARTSSSASRRSRSARRDEENTRLRRLLALRDRLPLATLSGEVIGREAGGWVRSLTVNRGRGDGIAQQTPVIVPDGLVGRVVQVRPGASVVQLLNDPASTVGAVVQRTRTAGLVEGEPGGAVRFKFMARDGAGVARGRPRGHLRAWARSSRKGLPVGRVRAIEDKGSALFHFAVLAPGRGLRPRRGGAARHRRRRPRTWPALFPPDG